MKTEVLLSTCVGMLGILASWEVWAPRRRLTTSIGLPADAPLRGQTGPLSLALEPEGMSWEVHR